MSRPSGFGRRRVTRRRMIGAATVALSVVAALSFGLPSQRVAEGENSSPSTALAASHRLSHGYPRFVSGSYSSANSRVRPSYLDSAGVVPSRPSAAQAVRTARVSARHVGPLSRVLASTGCGATGTIADATGFEDADANLAPGANCVDWNSFSPTWTGTAPYQTGTATLGGLTFYGLTDAVGSSTDTIYAGGVQQTTVCPGVTTHSADNKADISRIYVASEYLNGQVYLFLAWERAPQNNTSSDVLVSFEFNQGKLACSNGDGFVQRTPGDLLVVFNFHSGTSSYSTIEADEWDGSTWQTLPTPPYEALVNSTALPNGDTIGPNGNYSLGPYEFGEAGVNLSALSLSGNGGKACETFGEVYGESRTSQSGPSSQMKDYVGPAPVDVSNCASPTVVTNASTAGSTAVGSGGTTSDSATLSGGNNPSGTIQFSITAPDGTTSNVGGTVTVNGNGIYNSPASVPLTEVGTYTWHASYSGDSLNNGATDDGANESVTAVKASPAVATQASESGSGIVGTDSTSDSATVSGGNNPTGTIQFTITAPDGTTSNVGSAVTITGDGTYNSPASVPLTEVGTYTWHASYSGDSLNNGAIDNGDNESVTAVKASPAIATNASAGGVVGQVTLQDTATLSGGDNPGGTITFTLTAPDNTVADTEVVTASGDGIYSTSTGAVASQVGTYTWSASYSGDANNHGATDNGDNETAVILKASPAITTKASETGSGVVGLDLTSDSAVLSGSYNGSGTIQFSISAPDGTTSNVGSAITVTGDGTYNSPASVPLSEVGTYTWHASYSGDALNHGAIDNGDNESVNAIKASPKIATHASVTGLGVVGVDSTSDSAVVSGGDVPTGTIRFTITAPDGSTSNVGSAVTVSGDGTYNSPASVPLTEIGTYTWHASYSGDSLNNAAIDNGDNESIDTGKASPEISTQASSTGSGVVGTDTTSDSAVLSGGANPTGTIQFTITAPDGSTSNVGSAVPVSGDGTYNSPASVSLSEVGTYTWHASYSGDTLNHGAIDNGDNESVNAIKASPSIATTQSEKTGSVGDVLKDTATLSGGDNPSGTITFDLYDNDSCSGTPLDQESASVSGNGNYATPSGYGTTKPGTYYWVASYGGDSNNSSATAGCADEPVVVNAATIQIVKTADAPQVNAGSPIGFTLTVFNNAGGDAHGVKLSDTLPTAPGLAWAIADTGTGWGTNGCTIDSGILTCGGSSGATVPAGTTQAASTFTVHITSPTTGATGGSCPGSGVIDNTGSVTTGNDGSGQSTASTCVQALVDLSITKSGSPNPDGPPPGNITWTMVVKNNGPSTDSGVTVADPVPAGNTFVSVTTTKGSCAGGAVVSCDIGTMAAGESVTITLVTKPSITGNVTNTATVVGNYPETNTANNTASAIVLVVGAHTPPPTYCTAVAVHPKQLYVGRKTNLRIKVTQHGKPVAGVRVKINGPHIHATTRRSNKSGMIVRSLKPTRAGIIIFKPLRTTKSCAASRVGITGIFTPPVTG